MEIFQVDSNEPLTTHSSTMFNKMISISCQNENKAGLACFNKDCISYAFVCNDKQCQCRKKHKSCLMLDLQSMTMNLQATLFDVNPLEQMVNNQFDKIIDKLSDQRDKLLKDIKRDFSYFGLNEQGRFIMQSFERGRCSSIKGNKIWEACLYTKKQNNTQKQFKNIMEKIKSLLQKFKQQSNSLCSQINKQLQPFEQKQYQEMNQSSDFNYKNKLQNKANNPLFFQSNVAVQKQQIQTISKFFKDKIIKGAYLLYKASQNNFEAEKFHEICDNITPTLILCQTSFNKKIGGYTNIPWQKVTKNKVREDQNLQSFVFSLTNQDKFELKDKRYAISHRQISQGPNFGASGDLVIGDKANINKSSYANIGSNYKNSKNIYNSNNVFKQFSGDSFDKAFRVIEWQVWQLDFQISKPIKSFQPIEIAQPQNKNFGPKNNSQLFENTKIKENKGLIQNGGQYIQSKQGNNIFGKTQSMQGSSIFGNRPLTNNVVDNNKLMQGRNIFGNNGVVPEKNSIDRNRQKMQIIKSTGSFFNYGKQKQK